MCKPHWRAYTNALRKAAVERKAAETETSAGVATEPVPIEASEPTRTRAKRSSKAVVPEGGSQGDAG
jgi:hypothetical protein